MCKMDQSITMLEAKITVFQTRSNKDLLYIRTKNNVKTE